jgi:hypothetical protein
VARAYGRKRGAPGKGVIHNGASGGYACHVPSITRGDDLPYPRCRSGCLPLHGQVNSRLPSGEQSPMLGTVTPIYRTEISA